MEIKRNDHKRVLYDTLSVGDDAVDLTGATVQFLLKTVPGTNSRNVSHAIAATLVDADAGEVSVELLATHTEVAGKYYFEWEVTFASGAVTTFPSSSYGKLTITEDLG